MRSRLGLLLPFVLIAALVPAASISAHTSRSEAARTARSSLPRHLERVVGRVPALGTGQNDVTLEGVLMGRRASLFDLGIYGGGAYNTDWFAVDVDDAVEFGSFELTERADGDRQQQFFDFNLNDALSVNRRLTRVSLDTGRQLGSYGKVFLRSLDDLGRIRTTSTECSDSRFRRGFAMGTMRVDPTGRGEPEVLRGRFRILVFRDTLQFGNGCPPPPQPPPCFDFTLEFNDGDTGTRLLGQYNESTQVLNMTWGTSQTNGVNITREIHSRDQGSDLWEFQPVNDRWKLDPASNFFNTGTGGLNGSPGPPTLQGQDACGLYDRHSVTLDAGSQLEVPVDFVHPDDRPVFDGSDRDFGLYIFRYTGPPPP